MTRAFLKSLDWEERCCYTQISTSGMEHWPRNNADTGAWLPNQDSISWPPEQELGALCLSRFLRSSLFKLERELGGNSLFQHHFSKKNDRCKFEKKVLRREAEKSVPQSFLCSSAIQMQIFDWERKVLCDEYIQINIKFFFLSRWEKKVPVWKM